MINDTVTSLDDLIVFTYAKTSDFNQIRDKKGIMVNLDPLNAVPQYATEGVTNYMKAWSCTMAFYQFDKEDSIGDDYALILDETDILVDKFLNKLNFYSAKSDQILIQNVNQQAFIKATSDILTGHILTFTIFAQDDFDYCEVDCRVEDECRVN